MARDGVGELVAGLEPVFRFTEPRDPATGTMEILHEGFLVRFDIEAMLAALSGPFLLCGAALIFGGRVPVLDGVYHPDQHDLGDRLPADDADENAYLLRKRAGHTFMWIANTAAGTPPEGFSEPPPACCSWFRNGQKWRTVCEGRISVIKRRGGLNRCRYKGEAGMQRWVGLGVIADNLINIGRALEKQSAP